MIPELKSWNIKLNTLSTNQDSSTNKEQPKAQTNIKISSTKIRENEVVTVRPLWFTYEVTDKGPRLIYQSHKCSFYAEKEWFQYRVLKSINRTFKIRINDYTGFSFVPYTDKQEFANLLKNAYEDVQNQVYDKELADCLNKIDKYSKRKVRLFINSCRCFLMKTSIEDYCYDADKQAYMLNVNVIKYLNINNKSVLHISLQEIIENSGIEEYYDKFKDKITERWPDGILEYIDIDEILGQYQISVDML